MINKIGLELNIWDSCLFLNSYLNDLLFVPILIPLMFTSFYYLGLRNQSYPSKAELLVHICLWSLVSEYISPKYLHQGYSDPWDVACYFLGGAIYYLCHLSSGTASRKKINEGVVTKFCVGHGENRFDSLAKNSDECVDHVTRNLPLRSVRIDVY